MIIDQKKEGTADNSEVGAQKVLSFPSIINSNLFDSPDPVRGLNNWGKRDHGSPCILFIRVSPSV